MPIKHCRQNCIEAIREKDRTIVSTKRQCLTGEGAGEFIVKFDIVKPDNGEKYLRMHTSYSGPEWINSFSVRLWTEKSEVTFDVQNKRTEIIDPDSNFIKRCEVGMIVIKNEIQDIIKLAGADKVRCRFYGDRGWTFGLSKDAVAGLKEIVREFSKI